MKKLLLTVLITTSTMMAFSQKAKVVSAHMYRENGQLDKAKEAIDEAILHEKSMDMPKTWFYRGEIYLMIYNHPEFGELAENPLQTAYQSFEKSIEIDEKKYYEQDYKRHKPFLINGLFEQGVKYFNNKNYKDALSTFETVLQISPNDSLSMLNAAFSAERSDQPDIAKHHYEQLIKMKYNDVRIFSYLAVILQKQGDNEAAMEVIKEGRRAYPEDQNLIIQELNFYLGQDNQQEALTSIDLAIDKDPENAQLHFAKGTLLDKAQKLDGAIESYKRAIELDGEYFDAFYNLGGLYFNQGAEMYNTANDIPPNKLKEYEEAKKKFEEKFNEAMPYLEKALELQPDDVDTMNSLKQLYARTGDTEKYEKIKEKMEASNKE